MNDSMGGNGHVPSRVLYCTVLIFPIINTDIHAQAERIKTLETTQTQMNAIAAEKIIQPESIRKIPPTPDRHKLGEEVFAYFEQGKSWKGPYIVYDCIDRMVTVKNIGAHRKMYKAFQ